MTVLAIVALWAVAGLLLGTTYRQEPTLLDRLIVRVCQRICGWCGHDNILHFDHGILHFDHGRLSLQCIECGFLSKGWDCHGKGRA